jgi:tRNA A37 methylthiotransferase MiaB
MQGTVDNRIIKQRVRILRDLNTELASKFRQQFIGETATVLTENSNQQPSGRSERYFMVFLEKTDKELEKNEIITVKLLHNAENGLIGFDWVCFGQVPNWMYFHNPLLILYLRYLRSFGHPGNWL